MSPRVTRIWTVLFAMVLCAPAVSAATAPPAHAAHATTAGAMPSPDAVLAALKAGNERHAKHQYTHPHQSAARMHELTTGQQPHAVILACADSRVGPEIVFDQGLGDLFVVRVAGNVATDPEIASIESRIASPSIRRSSRRQKRRLSGSTFALAGSVSVVSR